MSASTKHTELSLRTAFILNPVKLLDEVCAAIMTEEQSSSQALLTLIVKHDYINLIVGLIGNHETTDEVRDSALWTTGLLMASDNNDIRVTTLIAVSPLTIQISNLLFNKEGAWKNDIYGMAYGCRSAAYLMQSIVRFGDEAVKADIADLLNPNMLTVFGLPPLNAQSDYFYALQNLFKSFNLPPRELVSAFLKVSTHGEFPKSLIKELHPSILNGAYTACVSTLCERDHFIHEDNYPYAFQLFEALIQEGSTKSLTEHLWALSNLLCEPGAADCLLMRVYNGEDELLPAVMSLILDENTDKANTTKEAIWVIANFITNVKNPANYLFLVQHLDWLRSGLSRFSHNRVVREAIQRFDQLEEQFYPVDSDSESDSDSDASSETTDVYNSSSGTNAPELLVAEAMTQTEAAPPSALQLLVGRLPVPSEKVRHLVSELVGAGVYSWIPITDNTVFTVADMRWMEASGYIVSQGHFGIAPWLRWGA